VKNVERRVARGARMFVRHVGKIFHFGRKRSFKGSHRRKRR
jgi:ribosomal protein L24E